MLSGYTRARIASMGVETCVWNSASPGCGPLWIAAGASIETTDGNMSRSRRAGAKPSLNAAGSRSMRHCGARCALLGNNTRKIGCLTAPAAATAFRSTIRVASSTAIGSTSTQLRRMEQSSCPSASSGNQASSVPYISTTLHGGGTGIISRGPERFPCIGRRSTRCELGLRKNFHSSMPPGRPTQSLNSAARESPLFSRWNHRTKR